jgi:diadenylate cyclase
MEIFFNFFNFFIFHRVTSYSDMYRPFRASYSSFPIKKMLLFDIGFLQFGIMDALDVLIVGYLMFLIYRLLRGTVAFNIFVGVISLYALWWLVKALKMDLLSQILGQFVSVGVIVIAIVFQPELRRFLLLLGNQTLRGRFEFLHKYTDNIDDNVLEINELHAAILELSKSQTGGLIVIANNSSMFNVSESGVVIDAKISKALIISIFNKESPMHDGAIVIAQHKILAAGSVLPLSENSNLPRETGLRHRAAVGASETSNVTAFIISEESGKIAMAHQGQLSLDLNDTTLMENLVKYYGTDN